MHTPTLVVSLLLAAAAATAVSLALRPAEPIAATTEVTPREVAELRDHVAQLQKQLGELQRAPAAASAPVAERTAAPEANAEVIAAAVEAYLLKRAAAGEAVPAAAGAAERVPLDTLYGELAGTSFWVNTAAWKKAFAEGRMDELIAKFEADAKANPNDTKKQMALANAYLSYLQMDSTKWQLSMKADQTFDRVLAIDDHHWEARFSKALSYTFYPDFLGKKKDAIANFQVLVDQQDSMPVNDSQAQTYLYLGNLLEAKDPAKAQEIWQRGLRRHPNNEELRKKLGQ